MSDPMTRRMAMCHAAEMGRKESWPRRYYWGAVWWRLHAKEAAAPAQPLQWSRNQLALYRDCLANPDRYINVRLELTDWQKFQAARRGEEE